MKRIKIIAITFLAGFVVGCAVPAHAELYDCLSVINQNGKPDMGVTKQVLSLETHQGYSELALKDSSRETFTIFATYDANKPAQGDSSTYMTFNHAHYKNYPVHVSVFSDSMVIKSLMFDDFCTVRK